MSRRLLIKLHNFVMGEPMADDEKELKDQRVVTMMSPSELEAIDDWMFQNRIRSRGEAIRRLCQIGLEADHKLSTLVKKLRAREDLKRLTDAMTEAFDLAEKLPPDANLEGDDADVAAWRAARERMTNTATEFVDRLISLEHEILDLLILSDRISSAWSLDKYAQERHEARSKEQADRIADLERLLNNGRLRLSSDK